MSNVQPRFWQPKGHRAVDWNEKAIQKVIDEHGCVYAGLKEDGIRCHIFLDDTGTARVTTREGIEIKALEEQRADWQRAFDTAPGGPAYDGQPEEDPDRASGHLYLHFRDRVIDAEVVVPGIPFEDASGLLRRHEQIECPVLFVLFDCPLKGDFDGSAPSTETLIERRALMRTKHWDERLPGSEHPKNWWVYEDSAVCYSIADIRQRYEYVRSLGHEGLVIKDPRLPYRRGKVSGWWKVKPGCGADFAPGWEGDGKIVGYVWGEQGKANEGKIVGFRVALEDGTEVNATGLTQAQIETYTERKREWSAGGGFGADGAPYMGRYCEVRAMEKTKAGSLRHPSFYAFRDLDYCPGVKV